MADWLGVDVDKATCLWPDECALPLHGAGLCKRHWQQAKRLGTLEDFRAQATALRSCFHCGGPMDGRVRQRATHCSKSCYNAAYKISGASRPTAEKQREYANASYRRKRLRRLTALGARTCKECGAALPATARLSRKYCTRKCINRASLRDRADGRREAVRLRRARIKAANSPGVSDRDWQSLIRRHNRRCAYCGERAVLTMDHVVPIARGGWHAIGNVLPACLPCNASKRDDLLIYWLHGRAKARLKIAL